MINNSSFITSDPRSRGMFHLHSFIREMNRISIVLLVLFALSSISSVRSPPSPARLRRRAWIQEEIRQSLLSSITSLKGEIADVILDELIEHHSKQSSKLHQLEEELRQMKHLSLPLVQKRRRSNRLIHHLSAQQQSLSTNLSQIQQQLNHLSALVHQFLPDDPIGKN